MPRYQDASGYLLELQNTVNQNWFSAAVERAISSNGEAISQQDLENFWSYALGVALHTPNAAPLVTQNNVGQSQFNAVFLEQIGSFRNFKKLSNNLSLNFTKKITIIFGKNGSGKSSICEALKVLANPDTPPTPLQNVRDTSNPEQSSFSYQFQGWNAPSIWSRNVGFGAQAQFIKYFDSTVAIANSTGNMAAENAVQIVAFRLEIFDYVRSAVNSFQNFCSNRLAQKSSDLSQRMNAEMEQLKDRVDIQSAPFNLWQLENPQNFENWLLQFENFNNEQVNELISHESQLKQYQAASSDQGQLILKTQLSLLQQLDSKITSILELCEIASPEKLVVLEANLANKKAAQVELSKNVMPDGQFSQQHQNLIVSAYERVGLEGTEICPLCFQNLSIEAKNLFHAYHAHLTSSLQKEIEGLSRELQIGVNNQVKIRDTNFGDISVLESVSSKEFLTAIIGLLNTLKEALPEEGKSQASCNLSNFNRSEEFRGHLTQIKGLIAQLDNALKSAIEGSDQLKKKILQTQDKIGGLVASRALSERKQDLLNICSEAKIYARESNSIRRIDFTTLLRNLTLKGKEAHSELVLETFEEKLNSEYLALSGMNLEQMGVELVSRGAAQNIMVSSKIGGEHVHRILSEGEQKVHALAIFMAEATAYPNQVLVFDDPVTSFDYNYVSNFCQRFRNFSRNHPNTQIIVLTHNWDFFVNLQTTLNRSGQNNDFSIQVLENCTTVEEYKEKWDELCNEINLILAPSNGEPATEQKERVCGLMRRLIERLNNEFVFNNQRHQYKIKTLQESNFESFTKLVPLKSDEANTLRDLYSDLSPPEHDDLRNFYTTKTSTQLNIWYQQILTIKTDVENRRP